MYDEGSAHSLKRSKKFKFKENKNRKWKKGRKKIKKWKGKSCLIYECRFAKYKIINSIGRQLLKVVVNEINVAGIYSIAMHDCTTDSSHADQLSIIIQYLNKSLDIVERLVRIQRVKESSAKGLFNTLQEILNKSTISLSGAVGAVV